MKLMLAQSAKNHLERLSHAQMINYQTAVHGGLLVRVAMFLGGFYDVEGIADSVSLVFSLMNTHLVMVAFWI